jgi:hypothetical protein
MTEWKSADIVTTTYGTIKKAQQESFDEGVAFEQARIIKLLQASDSVCVDFAIELIEGTK